MSTHKTSNPEDGALESILQSDGGDSRESRGILTKGALDAKSSTAMTKSMDESKQSTPEATHDNSGAKSGAETTKKQAPPDPSGASSPKMAASSSTDEEDTKSVPIVNDPPSKSVSQPPPPPPAVAARRKDPPPSSARTATKATETKKEPSSASGATDDGNDQVTKETPNKPLAAQVESSESSSASQQPQRRTTQQPASAVRTTASSLPGVAAATRPRNRTTPTTYPSVQAGVRRPLPLPQAAGRPPAVPAHSSSHSTVAAAAASGISSSSKAAQLPAATQSRPIHPTPPVPRASAAAVPPGSRQPQQQQQQQHMQYSQQHARQQQNAHAQQPQQQQQQTQQQQHQQQQQQQQTLHRSLYEEQISQQRSVLVDRYAPYIEHSDRSLKDARKRLETALGQVRQLRSAFTERVYGKYRVCLRPAESLDATLQSIKSDPAGASRRLEKHIRHIKEEKELEKKEAHTLNEEISKMGASQLNVNADNADQLMYISAGLSLVILPEDKVDPKVLEGYEDRAPVNPTTGQRVRSISQAAAAAGEVMLERTRKSRAMRKQWQQQRKTDPGFGSGEEILPDSGSPLDLLTNPATATGGAVDAAVSGEDRGLDVKPAASAYTTMQPGSTKATNASRANSAKPLAQQPKTLSSQAPPVLLSTQSQEVKGQKKSGAGKTPISIKAPEPSTAKFGRSRGGAGISVHVSLSLNPTADEITEQPSRASTAALLARGVGTAQGISRASPQQRLRHPHPTSAGGRQRASSATSARKELANLIQAPGTGSASSPQSYLHLALPPLPTPLERRERKSLQALDPSRSSSSRAKKAIASVLGNFYRSSDAGHGSTPPLTKIDLLHDIQRSRKGSAKSGVVESPKERPIDPTLAFSVLQAIGLITEAAPGEENRSPAMLDDKIQNLSRGEKRKLESLDGLTSLWDKLAPSKKPRYSDAFMKKGGTQPKQVSRSVVATATGRTSPPIEIIRGGGEMISEGNDDSSGQGVSQAMREANARKNNQRAGNSVYANHVNNHVGNHVDNRMLANNIAAQNARQAQSRWEGQQRQSLGMMNSHLAGNSVSLGMNHPQGAVNAPVAQNHQNQQVQAAANNEQYQAQNNYAYHLAHQLRNAATNNMAGMSHGGHPHGHGEVPVANFMNNLHQSGQWSSIGNSAAAMAAAQSSLAALGLSVPMGVYNSVQDRAARALLAREQQNVAAAHAVAAHQQSMATSSAFAGGAANPGFQPTTNQTIQQRANAANARNALLNSAAAQSYGVVNQAPVGVPIPQQQRSSAIPVANPVAQGYARTVGNSESNNQGLQPRVTVPVQRTMQVKRKAEDSPNFPPRSDQTRASSMPNMLHPSNTACPKRPKQSYGVASALPVVKPVPQIAPKMPPTRVETGQPKPIPAAVAPRKPLATVTSAQKGMSFFSPNAPAALSSEQVQLVRTGQLHKLSGVDSPSGQPRNTSEILEYLVAVGTAVPIPKALILSSLKDRLNIPGFKTLASNAGYVIPREIVVAVILVWLWNYHEEDFQRAFAKSGRIDVDPTCKWLVHAAVDASVRALTLYITESEMTAGVPRSSSESPSGKTTFSVGLASASVVSKTLTTESCRGSGTDSTLPQFHELAKFLDECRLVALHSRSQERVLLASLISLKSVMSESFAHAYVSSIVRAGDALGHEALADLVADEEQKISSMLPYDILRDAGGNWEDPCRPSEGFNPNLSGDVLTKVAHARAIIQKSLRRLQDRHSIKGGTATFGAYVDTTNGQTNSAAPGSSASGSSNKSVNGVGGTPKSWNKRKGSGSSSEAVPNGTGSGAATSWALYDPKHFSAPLAWNIGAPENTPYGRHRGGAPASLSGLGSTPASRKPKKAAAPPNGTKPKDPFGRSTHEIDWNAVADSFDRVKLPGAPSAHAAAKAPRSAAASALKTIISPYCRQIEASPEPIDDESDTEEDLSDEAVLARHQIVLDGMKEKLTAFMEARKKMQERRKKTSQKSNS